MIQLVMGFITVFIILSIIYFYIKYNRPYVEIDIDRRRIYGWYRGNILSECSFTSHDSAEELI